MTTMRPTPFPLSSFMRQHMRPMSRDKADTLFLLVTCILVLAPHAGHLPAWIISTCVVILLWRAWITFRGNRMPPRWLLLPIAVLAIGNVYWNYKTIFSQEAGVSMTVLLLTLKLLEMHAKRDLFVVLFLSFFIVLTGFFYSQSIGSALMMITAVGAILTTQLSFQYTGRVPPLKQRLQLGFFILGLATPLALVLFLLFPRIQGPLWSMPSDASTGRSGLSGSMAPGNISQLAMSDDIAFTVKFIDPPPPKSKLYWRGPVLGAYDGRTWSPLSLPHHPLIVIPRHQATRYQVTLEPNGQHWLFALDIPQAVPALANNPTSAGQHLELLATLPINERIHYEAASFVDFYLQPYENPQVLQQWLALPENFNPRTWMLAAQLRKQSDNNTDLIDTTLRYFREQPFRYTLEPPALGKHAVDEFLFDIRAGFCEHYASAFVVLMRAMHIPARVITGYQGGTINPVDGFMTIRQSDAHAWAEVWLESRGWTRIDPTAAVSPNRIEVNLASAIPRRLLGGLITLDGNGDSWLTTLQILGRNWDALTNAWNQSVLNYTPEKQRNFINSLGLETIDWHAWIILIGAISAALAAIATLPLLMNRTKTDPIEALYQSLCKMMAKQGYPRLVHEGPRTYSARLTSPDSHLTAEKRAAVTRFLQYYEILRYSTKNETPMGASLSQLKFLFAECR